MNPERRLAILLVTPELFIELCKPGKHELEVAQHPLPKDARFVGADVMRQSVDFDAGTACVRIIFESDELRPVPVGHKIPEWPGISFASKTTAAEALPACPKCERPMPYFEEYSSAEQMIYRCVDCGTIHVKERPTV
jgi:hypothetical protein